MNVIAAKRLQDSNERTVMYRLAVRVRRAAPDKSLRRVASGRVPSCAHRKLRPPPPGLNSSAKTHELIVRWAGILANCQYENSYNKASQTTSG